MFICFLIGMGCTCGKYHEHFTPEAGVPGRDSYTLKLLKELKFTPEDVDALFTAFNDMDSDDSGVIRLDELLTYFKIKRTVLIEKIFEDKTAKYPFFLDFEQFVVYSWQFLSLPLNKVGSFAFHLMDTKNTGSLSQEKMKFLIELMHNKCADECDTVQRLVKKCSVLHGEKISLKEFEAFSDSHRILCDPFRNTQIAFQSKLLGRPSWKRIRLETEANTEGDYIADKILAKFTLERKLNTSVIELGEKTNLRDQKMEQMMSEQDEYTKTSRSKEATPSEVGTDAIVIPPDSKIRVPKSAALHKKPRLISSTMIAKKKKKKKRHYINRRGSSMEIRRRRSLDDTGQTMLGDINNVEIFKSSSLDGCDGQEKRKSALSLSEKDEGDEESFPGKEKISAKQGKYVKDGSVMPV